MNTSQVPFEFIHYYNQGIEINIQELCIDSRKLIDPVYTLFFAIRGKNHDGHDFLKELHQKGVRNFVVESSPEHFLDHSNYWLVKNSIQALQQITAFHRSKFYYPVIGITGSNGKTIVKEWLWQLLSSEYTIVRSPRSYNSQVGVPLSVWQMAAHHTLAIFEAGISEPSEMVYLRKVIQPTLGVFTNLGTAHDEGFRDRNQKFLEKWQLFKNCEAVFIQKEVWEEYNFLLPSSELPKVYFWEYSRQNNEILLLIKSLDGPIQSFGLNLPFNEQASIQNALHCVCMCLHLGVPLNIIQERLYQLKGVQMRLELKKGRSGSYLIDDTYNNDLAGLKIALDFMESQRLNNDYGLILSDILESSLPLEQLYQEVSLLVNQKQIKKLIGVGPDISHYQDLFSGVSEKKFYPSTGHLLAELQDSFFQNCTVLIKGARAFTFERVIHRLEYHTHRTILEINLDALAHNLNFYRSLLQAHTKIMVMVKAFAYGSGSAEIANFLQYYRVDYLAVAYTDEGVMLRNNGVKLPVMVMNPSEESFQTILEYGLEPELYSFGILEKWLAFLKGSAATSFPYVHLKLDTGMHRLGFEFSDMAKLIGLLVQNHQLLPVASIMSHLAASDNVEHDSFTQEQIALFKKMASAVSNLYPKALLHLLNSPGIVRFPEAQFDMVRLGIGLYGVEPGNKYTAKLRSISCLKTVVSQVKQVSPLQTVGYNRKGKITRPATIATIAIGYSDGFSRAFSNGVGKVKIKGQLAPVIGNVCMDMTMVDITHIPGVSEGDEVIIFDSELTIHELASAIDTIPYEILTNVSERVPRIFYME